MSCFVSLHPTASSATTRIVVIIMVSLKDFDFFPKTLEDYRVRTYAGAAVSVISIIIMVCLFISELSLYYNTTVRTHTHAHMSVLCVGRCLQRF